MLLLYKSKVKYGTPPVRDVVILQYYDEILVMSNRGNFTIDYRDIIGDELSINNRNYRNFKNHVANK